MGTHDFEKVGISMDSLGYFDKCVYRRTQTILITTYPNISAAEHEKGRFCVKKYS